eukprot:6443796-Prymnesium_polylepis.1
MKVSVVASKRQVIPLMALHGVQSSTDEFTCGRWWPSAQRVHDADPFIADLPAGHGRQMASPASG